MAEMGSVFWHGGGYMEDAANVSGGADGVTVTSSATAHVKGSWTQIDSSTAFACAGLLVHCSNANANVAFAIDIGIGAAASEVIIFPDFVLGAQTRMPFGFYIPIAIPAGVRIAARCAASTLSSSCRVYCTLVANSPLGLPSGGQIGYVGPAIVDAQTYGVRFFPGGGSYNAYTVCTASSAFDARAILLNFHSSADTAPNAQGVQIELSVGAAASEVIILERITYQAAGTADVEGPGPSFWFPCQIPAGSRIAIRAEASSVAEDALVGVYILG